MASPNGTSTQKPLRIGVLYEETQMTDLAGLDVLGSISTRIFEMVSQLIPSIAPLKPFAVPMEFLYIASSTNVAWTSPEMYVRPTHTYENAPRDLDIVLIGGPNPATVADASLKFLQEAAKQTKAILTTCSGGMWLARSGVLDGKKATTNRILIEKARELFPAVEWLDQRWVVSDGHFEGAQIWTAGGAGCGIDMTIEYASQNFHEKMVELACAGLEFQFKGRSQFYQQPPQAFA